MNYDRTTINNTQLLTFLPVPATVIATQLAATTQDSDWVDCACSSGKCIRLLTIIIIRSFL